MTITVSFYDDFMKLTQDGTINLTTDTFRVILVNGYTYDASHTKLSDVAGYELADGNGYVSGGLALSGQTLDFLGDTTTFDSNDSIFTASGGNIGPATGAIIYSDTSTDNMLGCYIDFGGSKTAVDGTTFLLAYNAGGVFNTVK